MSVNNLAPEILSEIFWCLIDEPKNLYSPLLVNKIWCQNAVSFLWRKPFSIPFYEEKRVPYKIIDTMLPFLPEQSITTLGLNKSRLSAGRSNFQYPSFIRELRLSGLSNVISVWFQRQQRKRRKARGDLGWETKIRTVLKGVCEAIGRSGTILDVLWFDIGDSVLPMEDVINCLTFENTTGISKITDLFIDPDICEKPRRIARFTDECHNIKTLTVRSSIFDPMHEVSLDEISLLLVKNQVSLRNIECVGFKIKASQKKSPGLIDFIGNYGHNLRQIEFYSCGFDPQATLEPLQKCLDLETLRIAYCAQISESTLHGLATANFPRLKRFDYLDDEEERMADTRPGSPSKPTRTIIQIISSSHATLEEINMYNFETGSDPSAVFDALSQCHNLRSLEFPIRSPHDLESFSHLFQCLKKLRALTLYSYGTNIGETLAQLGKVLPLSVNYFCFVSMEGYFFPHFVSFLEGLRRLPHRMEFFPGHDILRHYNELHLCAIQRGLKIVDGGFDNWMAFIQLAY